MITRSGQIEEMQDLAYRHGLVNAQIEIDLPLEIRALRNQRGWTQPELANRAGMKQPRISAMEKLGGAKFNIETLKRLAEAFDVALVVRFAPFSELLDWSDRFKPDEFAVSSFEEELPELKTNGFSHQSLNNLVSNGVSRQNSSIANLYVTSGRKLPQGNFGLTELGGLSKFASAGLIAPVVAYAQNPGKSGAVKLMQSIAPVIDFESEKRKRQDTDKLQRTKLNRRTRHVRSA